MLSERSETVIGLVLHPTKPVSRSVDIIIASARDRSVRVLAREIDRDRIPVEIDGRSDAQLVAEVDGLVALGGDPDTAIGRSQAADPAAARSAESFST